MLQITATELRRHLFEYLQRVEQGESIQIKLNGRVIGCLGPQHDDSEKAWRGCGSSARQRILATSSRQRTKRPGTPMKTICDTHALIWWCLQPDKLGAPRVANPNGAEHDR